VSQVDNVATKLPN